MKLVEDRRKRRLISLNLQSNIEYKDLSHYDNNQNDFALNRGGLNFQFHVAKQANQAATVPLGARKY